MKQARVLLFGILLFFPASDSVSHDSDDPAVMRNAVAPSGSLVLGSNKSSSGGL